MSYNTDPELTVPVETHRVFICSSLRQPEPASKLDENKTFMFDSQVKMDNCDFKKETDNGDNNADDAHIFGEVSEQEKVSFSGSLNSDKQSNTNLTRKERRQTLAVDNVMFSEHKCSTCGQSFKTERELKGHAMLSHLDDYPFPCSHCLARFTQFHHLFEHLRVWHNQRPYAFCERGLRFSAEGWLIHHMSRLYPNEIPVLKEHDATGMSHKSDEKRDETEDVRMKVTPSGREDKEPCDSNVDLGLTMMVDTDTNTGVTAIEKGSESENYNYSTCGQGFKKQKTLKEHAVFARSDERPYQCNVCFARFKQHCHLSEHIRTRHDPQRSNACCFCELRLSTQRLLMSHLRRLHPDDTAVGDKNVDLGIAAMANTDKKGNADDCGTVGKKGLNSEEYKCSTCKQSFKVQKALKEHAVLVHSEERLFQCNVCFARFKSHCNLSNHVAARHDPQRSYACSICGFRFLTQQRYMSHLKRLHPDPNDTTVGDSNVDLGKAVVANTDKEGNAGDCGTVIEEGVNSKEYKCLTCGRSFKVQKALKEHAMFCTMMVGDIDSNAEETVEERVSKSKNYSCTTCGQSLRTLKLLRAHAVLAHSDERPFQCIVCSGRFKLKCHLSDHVRTRHNPQRSYACSICGVRFSTQQHQMSHLRRIHSVLSLPTIPEERAAGERGNEGVPLNVTASSPKELGDSNMHQGTVMMGDTENAGVTVLEKGSKHEDDASISVANISDCTCNPPMPHTSDKTQSHLQHKSEEIVTHCTGQILEDTKFSLDLKQEVNFERQTDNNGYNVVQTNTMNQRTPAGDEVEFPEIKKPLSKNVQISEEPGKQ